MPFHHALICTHILFRLETICIPTIYYVLFASGWSTSSHTNLSGFISKFLTKPSLVVIISKTVRLSYSHMPMDFIMNACYGLIHFYSSDIEWLWLWYHKVYPHLPFSNITNWKYYPYKKYYSSMTNRYYKCILKVSHSCVGVVCLSLKWIKLPTKCSGPTW